MMTFNVVRVEHSTAAHGTTRIIGRDTMDREVFVELTRPGQFDQFKEIGGERGAWVSYDRVTGKFANAKKKED